MATDTWVELPAGSGGGGGSGTVTSVSVVSANGLAGTVANPTTTPAITLSTTITGLLKGNGTAISAQTVGDLTDAGTDGITITSGTGAVIGSGTSLAQHVADTTHNGYLSSTDWNTFSGKFNLPSLTAGSVLFSDGTTISQDNANLFWDNTNKKLGVGTNTGTKNFTVAGDAEIVGQLHLQTGTICDTTGLPVYVMNSNGNNFSMLQNVDADTWSIAYGGSSLVNGTSVISWNDFNQVGINQDLPNETLDVTGGNIAVSTPGFGIKIKEGSDAKMGTSVLVGGTVVVSNTSVTANSRIFLTAQNNSGVVGSLSISARTASTSFTILSTSAADTSTVAWFIVEPAT